MRQESGLWGGGDYLDQQNFYLNKIDEFIDRKFPKQIINGNPIDDVEKYEDRRGV